MASLDGRVAHPVLIDRLQLLDVPRCMAGGFRATFRSAVTSTATEERTSRCGDPPMARGNRLSASWYTTSAHISGASARTCRSRPTSTGMGIRIFRLSSIDRRVVHEAFLDRIQLRGTPVINGAYPATVRSPATTMATDLRTWRSIGRRRVEWFIRYSMNNYSYAFSTFGWGTGGDVPMPGDLRRGRPGGHRCVPAFDGHVVHAAVFGGIQHFGMGRLPVGRARRRRHLRRRLATFSLLPISACATLVRWEGEYKNLLGHCSAGVRTAGRLSVLAVMLCVGRLTRS